MTDPAKTGTDPAPTDPPSNEPPKGDPASGPTQTDVDKLKAALERERSLRKDAEKRAAEGEAHKAKLEELDSASKTETEKAVAAARKETAAEVLAAANWRLVNAEARALAAEVGFRSPLLAVKAVELDGITVSSDGVVDADAIKAALDALATAEPYLLKTDDGKPRTPKPDPSQGSGRAPALTGAEKGIAEAKRRFGDRAVIH